MRIFEADLIESIIGVKPNFMFGTGTKTDGKKFSFIKNNKFGYVTTYKDFDKKILSITVNSGSETQTHVVEIDNLGRIIKG